LLGLSFRENGVAYTLVLLFYLFTSALADKTFTLMNRLRQTQEIPGINSVAANRLIWENWNWSAGGDEWTLSTEWKESLLSDFLATYLKDGPSVLEIGIGAGRWTEHLVENAGSFSGVDLSEPCVELCRKRFSHHDHVRFFRNDGESLPFVEDKSVDLVWSYDVFVHINANQMGCYFKEFSRVLKPGGLALIHHGSSGGESGGWRSNTTQEAFEQQVALTDLELVETLSSWRNAQGEAMPVGHYKDDRFSILRKPTRNP
jgi:ubiquinone/menaquinone biosynthesis C-methylase UbiE